MRANFAIFLLFFGLAALDAVSKGDWLRIAFWLVIGTIFFVADRRDVQQKT